MVIANYQSGKLISNGSFLIGFLEESLAMADANEFFRNPNRNDVFPVSFAGV
jgi:hypothetical protein